ncbi:MAG: DUF2797 domain-containing protein [Candidatus Heimdallarchaeota archaeon]|nr:DUF2797 domain-containing protein [Candidatus Heimdallarchaeota archaeon]MCK4954422.1 DUF2797 domain-containing protein [Candidatus Heimdallarchaeota archaeon]
MNEHLIAVKWDPDTPPHVFLFLRNLDENPDEVYRKPLYSGHSFNVRILNEKMCIGHSINKKKYHLCTNITSEQYVRCFTCEQKDFEKCFLFCDASKPFGNCAEHTEAYEYCKSHPCSVYLALIANDIKVGVSFNPMKRWINQGADLAVEVFRADNGFTARKLEKEISTALQIPQAIRKTQKARKINYDITQSLPIFRNLTQKVIEFINSRSYQSSDSEILHQETALSSYYGKITELTVNPIINDVEKTQQVTGEIIGIKGKLLVSKRNNSYYVTNLTKMIGHLLSFSSTPLKMKGQKSLSDFFSTQ